MQIIEPLPEPEDTKPKAAFQPEFDPASLEDTNPNQPLDIPEPPRYVVVERGGIGQWLFALAVMGIASGMCLAIIVLAGFAGVRDELSAIGTEAVETRQADVATQYTRGNREFDGGLYEIAEIRFEYVETQIPGYQDAARRLQQVRDILAYTPTPSPTSTPTETSIPPTATLEEGQPTVAPSPTGPDPAALYGQAQTALNAYLYEDAIEWLEALRQLAPNYRRAEVTEQLMRALTVEGSNYLRGYNADGEDRLAQGVQLINRAADLGYNGEFIFEADFVSRYLAARAYMQGGLPAQALPILTVLCEQNCDWAYQGVTIRSMLQQVGGTPQ